MSISYGSMSSVYDECDLYPNYHSNKDEDYEDFISGPISDGMDTPEERSSERRSTPLASPDRGMLKW
jgi:hypothetical protein